MSDSALQDTFGSRVGLTTIIVASILVILFTWILFATMRGQAKRASQDFNSQGLPASNMAMPSSPAE